VISLYQIHNRYPHSQGCEASKNDDAPRRSINDQTRSLGWTAAVVVCVLLTASGCLPFLQQSQAESTRPPPTATATHTPVGFPTWPPTWTPTWTPTATATGTRYPTLTPRPGTPVPGGGGTSPGGGAAPGSKGTLSVEFWVTDKYCIADDKYAAEFWIQAQGGGGGYTYYRDIDKIAGPVSGAVSYKLRWMDCGGAPGTFFVDSADGQRVAKKFWVYAPECCTVDTPTP